MSNYDYPRLGDFTDVFNHLKTTNESECSSSKSDVSSSPLGHFDTIFQLIDSDKVRVDYEKKKKKSKNRRRRSFEVDGTVFNRNPRPLLTKGVKSGHKSEDDLLRSSARSSLLSLSSSSDESSDATAAKAKSHLVSARNDHNISSDNKHQTKTLPITIPRKCIVSETSNRFQKPNRSRSASNPESPLVPNDQTARQRPNALNSDQSRNHGVSSSTMPSGSSSLATNYKSTQSYLDGLVSCSLPSDFQQFRLSLNSSGSKTPPRATKRSTNALVPRTNKSDFKSNSDNSLKMNGATSSVQILNRKNNRETLLAALSRELNSPIPSPSSKVSSIPSYSVSFRHHSATDQSDQSSSFEESFELPFEETFQYGIHIFIDNSNIFIGAQHYVADSYQIPKHLVKLDYPQLFSFIETQANACVRTTISSTSASNEEYPVMKKVLVASKPMMQDCIQPAKNAGYETHLLDRIVKETVGGNDVFAYKEVKKERFVDELLHSKISESLLDYTCGVLCIVSGDGNWSEYGSGFSLNVARALKRNWTVVIFSFKKQLSSIYQHFQDQDRFFVVDLDEHVWDLVSVRKGK